MASTSSAVAGTQSSSLLKAEYQGHTGESKQLEHSIGSLTANHSVKDKTEYLSTLRSSVVKMQDEINAFLTAKMDEDNKSAAEGAKVSPADKKEEENYGEEVVDEE